MQKLWGGGKDLTITHFKYETTEEKNLIVFAFVPSSFAGSNAKSLSQKNGADER